MIFLHIGKSNTHLGVEFLDCEVVTSSVLVDSAKFFSKVIKLLSTVLDAFCP